MHGIVSARIDETISESSPNARSMFPRPMANRRGPFFCALRWPDQTRSSVLSRIWALQKRFNCSSAML